MDSKLNKIEEMATQIACAEVTNGQRSYWLYDISDEKLEKLAAASVKLAEKIAKNAEKYGPVA